jgi:hypothetical protein
MKLSVLLIATVLILPGAALAAQGDPRTIQGTVAWAPGPGGAPFVVVRTDDGHTVYADLSRAQSAPQAVQPGSRIAVTGVEGLNPYELIAAAVTIAPGPALAQPAPPAVPAPPGASVATPRAPGGASATPPAPGAGVAAPAAPRAERPPDRLDGKVQSVSGKRVVMRTTTGGHEVKVDMPTGDIATVLRPGDDITVFGRREGESFLATGFIRVEPSGSALPRQSPPRQSR